MNLTKNQLIYHVFLQTLPLFQFSAILLCNRAFQKRRTWCPISSPEFLRFVVSTRRLETLEIIEFLCQYSLKFFDRLFVEQQSIKNFQKYSKKFRYTRVSPGGQALTTWSRRNSILGSLSSAEVSFVFPVKWGMGRGEK